MRLMSAGVDGASSINLLQSGAEKLDIRRSEAKEFYMWLMSDCKAEANILNLLRREAEKLYNQRSVSKNLLKA